MKKYFVIGLVVMAFIALTVPVGADTVFNEMSNCIKGKGCGMCQKKCEGSQTQAPMAGMCKKTDVLGNKVPPCTDNSGKLVVNK
jgi:hypothetical protein